MVKANRRRHVFTFYSAERKVLPIQGDALSSHKWQNGKHIAKQVANIRKRACTQYSQRAVSGGSCDIHFLTPHKGRQVGREMEKSGWRAMHSALHSIGIQLRSAGETSYRKLFAARKREFLLTKLAARAFRRRRLSVIARVATTWANSLSGAGGRQTGNKSRAAQECSQILSA